MDRPSEAFSTAAAKQVWEYVYRELWPDGWRVRWVHRLNPLPFAPMPRGVTRWEEKLIELNWTVLNLDAIAFDYEPLDTLLHEFIHVRCPRLLHSKKFTRLKLGPYWGRLMGDSLFDPQERDQGAQGVGSTAPGGPPVNPRAAVTRGPLE